MHKYETTNEFQDFEDELCNRSDYIAALKDKVFPYFNLEYKRRVKPTCPFGLIWDMACTFAICFHSGNCMVDDILSCSNNIDPCQPQVHVQPFCKVSFQNIQPFCKVSFQLKLRTCTFVLSIHHSTFVTINPSQHFRN